MAREGYKITLPPRTKWERETSFVCPYHRKCGQGCCPVWKVTSAYHSFKRLLNERGKKDLNRCWVETTGWEILQHANIKSQPLRHENVRLRDSNVLSMSTGQQASSLAGLDRRCRRKDIYKALQLGLPFLKPKGVALSLEVRLLTGHACNGKGDHSATWSKAWAKLPKPAGNQCVYSMLVTVSELQKRKPQPGQPLLDSYAVVGRATDANKKPHKECEKMLWVADGFFRVALAELRFNIGEGFVGRFE